jgi:hypothetical protein
MTILFNFSFLIGIYVTILFFYKSLRDYSNKKQLILSYEYDGIVRLLMFRSFK